MIKASELRIGNIVNTFLNTTEGKLYTRGVIKALHMNTGEVENNCTMQYNMIEPVELNEQWLVVFGFEKYNECFYRIKFKGKFIDGWYLSNNNELTRSLSEFMVRIKYVHELQNFWFSLTSQELNANNE